MLVEYGGANQSELTFSADTYDNGEKQEQN